MMVMTDPSRNNQNPEQLRLSLLQSVIYAAALDK
jgi:hypothetical protein